jgi:hypothetical protein
MRIRILTLFTCAALLLSGAALAAQIGINEDGVHQRRAVETEQTGTCVSQSVDPDLIISPNSVACQAGGIVTENSHLRQYDLDGQFGVTDPINITEIRFGCETAGSPITLNISVATVPAGTPAIPPFPHNVVCQVDYPLPACDLTIEVVPITCPDIDPVANDIILHLQHEDCTTTGNCTTFFMGSNSAGEIAPSFLASASCGIVNPVPVEAINFAGIHYILDPCFVPAGGQQGVPALGPLGALLMVLALGAGSGYVLRRRA